MPALVHSSDRLDVATFPMAMEYWKANKAILLTKTDHGQARRVVNSATMTMRYRVRAKSG